MKKRLFLILCCLSLLTGCWDRRELDTLLYVTGLGFDLAGSRLKISAQANNINEQSGISNSMGIEEPGASSSYITLEGQGETVNQALRQISYDTSRELFLYQTELAIFGRDLAERGIADCIDYMVRDKDLKIDLFVVVSKTTAEDVLNTTHPFEKIPSVGMADMIGLQRKNSIGYPITLREMISGIIGGITSPVAIMVERDQNGGRELLKMSGLAIFDRDKMIGQMNAYQTDGLLWLMTAPKSRHMAVSSGGARGDLSVSSLKHSITPVIREGKYGVDIAIEAVAGIAELDYSDEEDIEETLERLQSACKSGIEAEINACVKKAKELRADVFGFGEKFRKYRPDDWAVMEENWKDIFENLEINLSIDLRIRNSGSINQQIEKRWR